MSGSIAVILPYQDRNLLLHKLSKAALIFQESTVGKDDPSTPAMLCQVWLPDLQDADQHGSPPQLVLKTKGMPFCIAGSGDLLALFRCVSCRFTFGLDPSHPHALGAPGRVYVTNTPELSLNVQQYSKTAYLRRAEAEQCHIQSSFLLPVFLSADCRDRCVAVLEIVTSNVMMDVVSTIAEISKALQSVGLCTCDSGIVHQLIPNRTANIALPNHVYILDRKIEGIKEQQNTAHGNNNNNDSRKKRNSNSSSSHEEGHNNNDNDSKGKLDNIDQDAGIQQKQDNNEDEDDDDDVNDNEEEDESDKKNSSGKRKRGKPGVNLSLEDLQSQFGVGLKDAAVRLGVCATTLKRACRRHGIQRWPRRALQKVSRALDDMERREGGLDTAAAGGGVGGVQGGGIGVVGGDSRWGVLANFIPAYHSSVAGGGTNLPALHQQQQQEEQEPDLPDGVIIIDQHAPPAVPQSTQSSQLHGTARVQAPAVITNQHVLMTEMPPPPPPPAHHHQQQQQPQLAALPGLSMGPSLSQLSLPPLPSEFDSFEKGLNASDDALWSVDPSMLEFLMSD